MATTPVNTLPVLGGIQDGDLLVGEQTPGSTGLVVVEGILYDADFNSSAGIMVTTAPNEYANREIEGVAGRTTVTDGKGTLGNIQVDIAADYIGQETVTTLGTVEVGTWGADIVEMEFGGTSKSLVPSNGGIVYTDADSMEILAGTPTAQRILQSGANSAPTWSTAVYPATTTINQILYSSAANNIAGLSTLADATLTTNSSGVPIWSTNLHTATTIGAQYIYRVAGTDVALADGGTGTSLTAPAANRIMYFNNATTAVDWLQIGSAFSITTGTLNFVQPLVSTGDGGTGFAGGYTNGQLLIGNTSTGGLSRATLTSNDSSVAITNGTGTINLSVKTAASLSAYRSTSQAISSATNTKVQFDVELFDTGNIYNNTTTYRATPTVAGKYVMTFTGTIAAAGTTTGQFLAAYIIKNGATTVASATSIAPVAGSTISASCNNVVDMNGTTDYVECFLYNSGTATTIFAGMDRTYFGLTLVEKL